METPEAALSSARAALLEGLALLEERRWADSEEALGVCIALLGSISTAAELQQGAAGRRMLADAVAARVGVLLFLAMRPLQVQLHSEALSISEPERAELATLASLLVAVPVPPRQRVVYFRYT